MTMSSSPTPAATAVNTKALHLVRQWFIPFLVSFFLLQHINLAFDSCAQTQAFLQMHQVPSPPDRLLRGKVSAAASTAATKYLESNQDETGDEPWVPWLDTDDGVAQYIFQDPTNFWKTMGTNPRGSKEIDATLRRQLCKAERAPADKAPKEHSTRKYQRTCEQQAVIQKSLAGGVGANYWYSAVSSQHGALFVKVDERKTRNSTIKSLYHVKPNKYEAMDILVPLTTKSRIDKLDEFFVQKIAQATKTHREWHGLKVRLLISVFAADQKYFTKKLLTKLNEKANGIEIVMVPCKQKTEGFNRAATVNCLLDRASTSETSAVALMDIDLHVSKTFVANALAYTSPAKSVYFPIFFSHYSPDVVSLVQGARNESKSLRVLQDSIQEDHTGMWRTFSTGMWVMAGSDAKKERMDESFVGWGGEDQAFYNVIMEKYNTVRTQDAGLVHPYHDKSCDGVQTQKQRTHCWKSGLKQDGGTLGIYLQEKQNKTPRKNVPSSGTFST